MRICKLKQNGQPGAVLLQYGTNPVYRAPLSDEFIAIFDILAMDADMANKPVRLAISRDMLKTLVLLSGLDGNR